MYWLIVVGAIPVALVTTMIAAVIISIIPGPTDTLVELVAYSIRDVTLVVMLGGSLMELITDIKEHLEENKK